MIRITARRPRVVVRIALVITLSVLFMTIATAPAMACVDHPPATLLTFTVTNAGPPVQGFFTYDPWSTFGSTASQYCACAFRFPTATIDSVQQVSLVETGTSTPIPGFNWSFNTVTGADVESLLGAGAGEQWWGFLSDQSLIVPEGTGVDFRVQATLKPGVDGTQALASMANGSQRVYTDEGNSDGTLADSHGGFVSTFQGVIPTLSQWGLILLTALILGSGLLILRRRRSQERQVEA